MRISRSIFQICLLSGGTTRSCSSKTRSANSLNSCCSVSAIEFVKWLAPVLLKEAAQDVVQQFAGVDGLKIERRFAARFKLQHSLPKKAISTIAISAQTAGTVNKLRAEPLFQQSEQMRIGNLAVVWSKTVPARSRSISIRRKAELLRNDRCARESAGS